MVGNGTSRGPRKSVVLGRVSNGRGPGYAARVRWILCLWLLGCGSAPDEGGVCTYTCPSRTSPTACVGEAALGAGASCDVGDRLPGRVLTDCCGRLLPLADVVCEARAVVVEFGAGWCTECRESAPQFGAWSREYAARGLRIVSVLKETDAAGSPATRDFCKCWGADYQADYTLVIDPADTLTTACSAGSLPTTLVVDSDGVIRGRYTGSSLDAIQAGFTEFLSP